MLRSWISSLATEFVLASHTDERRKGSFATVRHLLRNSGHGQVPGIPLPPRMCQVLIAVRPGDRECLCPLLRDILLSQQILYKSAAPSAHVLLSDPNPMKQGRYVRQPEPSLAERLPGP